MEKKIKRLKKAIMQERFSFTYGEREWYGLHINVGPLFCSYGKIGYEVYVYGYGTLLYDYELERITEDCNE